MKKIEQLMSQIKTQLKESINGESTVEEVNKVSEMDKSLDQVMEEYNKLQQDYDSLKDSYIEQVKSTGFKPTGSEDDDIGVGDTKSLDDVMMEELNKEIQREKERI